MLGPGLVNGALALALTTGLLMRVRHGVRSNVCDTVITCRRRNDGHPRQASAGWSYFPLCLPSAIVRLALDLAGIILRLLVWVFLGLVLARQWRNGGHDRRRYAGHF